VSSSAISAFVVIRRQQPALQKCTHQTGDRVAVLFERKVPGVEQVKFEILEIALVRVRAFSREDLIVPPPHTQRRWLVTTEKLVPLRVERRG
jgi:hypothetical protein